MDTEAWIAAGWDPGELSVQKLAIHAYVQHIHCIGSLALILFRAHTHAWWKKLQWWEHMTIMQIHKCPRL